MLAPPLSSVLLARLTNWPQLEELRKAAMATKVGSWNHALSGLRAGAGTELLSAISAARARVLGPHLPASADAAVTAAILHGTLRYDVLTLAKDRGITSLGLLWGWSQSQVGSAIAAVQSVIGASPLAGSECLCVAPDDLGGAVVFPHLSMLAVTLLSCGMEWGIALPLLAHCSQGRFDKSGMQFWFTSGNGALVAHGAPRPWTSHVLPSRSAENPNLVVIRADSLLLAVVSSLPLRPKAALARMRASSRFMPPYIRLPQDDQGNLIFPEYRVTSLIEKRDAWARIIGNVDGVTWAILCGRLVYPRVSWMLTGSWLKNHPSYENDEVKSVLGPKIATYLAQGALEWIPPDCDPPLYIEPTGAVFKPGPDQYRMISDARHGNKGLEHWGVRYHTALDFAAALDYSFFAYVDDVKDGYHLACLQGCTADMVWDYGITGFTLAAEGTGQQPTWGLRLHIGCSPRTCHRVCDKSANGVCTDGCLMRWAVAHFGQATAGSPLNCVALCLLRHMARCSSRRFEAARDAATRWPASQTTQTGAVVMSLEDSGMNGTQGVVWVDDFAFCCQVPYHSPCTGVVAGCPTCVLALPAAQDSRRYWHSLCLALGVPLHEGKSQPCGQQPEFAGFMHDTVHGLRLILPKKLEKLLHSVLHLGSSETASGRIMDQVRGRVLHYSACIKHLRICCASLSPAQGSTSPEDYDLEVPVDVALRSLCQHLVSVIFQYSDKGKELWPTPASTLFARFMAGTVSEALALLTWDAAATGWAALARWWEHRATGKVMREQLMIGTWPAEAAIEEQSHRETWAGCLALEALSKLIDLHAFAVLMRNDASAAIAALSKGSFGSSALQTVALRCDKLCAKLDIDLYCLHVPGLSLIEEGIDGASRGGDAFGTGANVESVRAAEVSDALWDLIRGTADHQGWKLTIDLFASASNHRTDRWVSWLPEPDAEAFDAFSIPSWRESPCPVCGGTHQEAVYAFPPSAILPKVVAKAVADQAVGIFVTPVMVTSPVWRKLRLASVLPGPDGYVRVRRAARLVTGPGMHGDLAIFACDFGRLRGSPDGWSDPGCAGAFRRRIRPACGSAADASDRLRLRAAIPRAVRHPDEH